MRGYQVYAKSLKKNGKLADGISTACFSGFRAHVNKVVCIHEFVQPETEPYVSDLIQIINEITPCSIVEIDTIKYIKFQMFDDYDRSLILLNFIRNLWYKNAGFETELFFKELKNSKLTDPLSILCEANKKACKKVVITDHSNCVKASELTIKTVKQLMNFGEQHFKRAKGNRPLNTTNFLTS